LIVARQAARVAGSIDGSGESDYEQRLPKNSSKPFAVGNISSRSPRWFLPNWPVMFPWARSSVAIVGSSFFMPFGAPGRRGYESPMIDDRTELTLVNELSQDISEACK